MCYATEILSTAEQQYNHLFQHTPPVFCAPLWVTPLKFCPIFGIRKLVSRITIWHCLRDMFSHFDRTSTSYRPMQSNSIYRTKIAMHGKSCKKNNDRRPCTIPHCDVLIMNLVGQTTCIKHLQFSYCRAVKRSKHSATCISKQMQ